MAICMRPIVTAASSASDGLAGSVPGARVDDVEQRLARREPAQVVAEQLDAPVQHPAARPRRVRRDDDVGQVVERRLGGSGSSRNVSRTAPPSGPSRSARSSARSSMSRPRATLMSHAPGLTCASVSASIMSSVSGVSGAARTTKSDSAEQLRQRLGPADAVEHQLADGALGVRRPRHRGSASDRRPTADGDDPAPERGRQRPDGPADRARARRCRP